ncbi:MAG TPA: sigma-70 family RNA polymerase sigma factor [Acidimicrobiia bacterium]|nr:sigma-70 family RNA polymerase sigma factor [Acidimicrobiia bacterium]
MDAAGFDDFYGNEYERHVRALALVTGDRDTARDAVDEALARAWERIRRGVVIESLGAWVRVVAMNVARGRFRQRARDERMRARIIELRPQFGDAPEAVIDVRRALATLPRRQREITVLFYFLDLSVQQIADELGIASGTVRASLHQARQSLAALLSDHSDVEVR